jgi:hypothetical protein
MHHFESSFLPNHQNQSVTSLSCSKQTQLILEHYTELEQTLEKNFGGAILMDMAHKNRKNKSKISDKKGIF